MLHPTDDTHARVVVVGAGQAGLSVAYELQRRGLRTGSDVIVLDRGPSTGGAWQFRWEALRLGLAHRVHDLPGMHALGLRFDDADRDRPAREVVEEYYRRYEEGADIVVERPVEAVAVREDGDGLAVEVRVGDDRPTPAVPLVRTSVLVSATGTWGMPFVPWSPGHDTFAGRQLDTTGYRSAEEFRGQDVVVVGGGTSAIGFVLELEGIAAAVTWVARRPVRWLDESSLDLESAVAAVAAQDDAARAGLPLPSIVSGTGVPMTPRMRAAEERGVLVAQPMFTAVERDGVRMADGSHRQADAIIWATGFRPELRFLAPLGLRERSGGYRVHDGATNRDPRVFLAGYGPQASTIGANRAGRLIARQVVERLRTGGTARDPE
ncbi:FAD-dependent oxidoreductase [Curtobacterium sp. RRHDQ10]|uniref:FAD-dependent oxidoreductase n=1 Tax=Curtobacterium phyllosphaerae TaxID=3413379 RepID=UPI003BF14BC5